MSRTFFVVFRFLPFLLSSSLLSAAQPPAGRPQEPLALVNVFVGTGGTGYGIGSASPGPCVPFSLVKPAPDTAGRSGPAAIATCQAHRASSTPSYISPAVT